MPKGFTNRSFNLPYRRASAWGIGTPSALAGSATLQVGDTAGCEARTGSGRGAPVTAVGETNWAVCATAATAGSNSWSRRSSVRQIAVWQNQIESAPMLFSLVSAKIPRHSYLRMCKPAGRQATGACRKNEHRPDRAAFRGNWDIFAGE